MPKFAVRGEVRDGNVSSVPLFKWRDSAVFASLTVLFWSVSAYFLFMWFSFSDGSAPLIFWGLTAILITRLGVNQLRWWSLPFMRKPIAMEPTAGRRVAVATTFVPGAESLQMLEETVTALVAMEYPHDTWVLDEGNDPAVKELCSRSGAAHFSRKDLPHYKTVKGKFKAGTKYGNYNSWLTEVALDRYDIVAAFDPDHVPKRHFLTSTIGYFDDAGVGYVQAPQVYYNQRASFIARGAAEETYNYYSSIQMSFYAMGYPVVVGCHNVHRASALGEVDGFPQHDADDLILTLKYRSSGWRGVYVPETLARGLTPVDWDGYFRQQLRWARSVLDVKFRIYPKVAGKLSFSERITAFFHGFYYLQGLSILFALLLLVGMLVAGSVPRAVNYSTLTGSAILVGAAMMCDLYRQRFYIERRREWGLHWRAGLLQIAKWPYLVLALYQVINNREMPYVITRKNSKRNRQLVWMLPHALTAIVVSSAWGFAVLRRYEIHALVHVSAAVTVAVSTLLVVTAGMHFPDAFMPSNEANLD